MASTSLLGSLDYFFEMERVVQTCDFCSCDGTLDALGLSFLADNVTARKRAAYLLQVFSQRAHEAIARGDERGVSLSLQCNSFNGKKFWFDDFLAIYNQLEGCHAMHLVQQIWPLFDHLYGLCNGITDEEERTQGDSIPPMTIPFLKSTIDLFLRAPLLQIRKALVHRLLSFQVETRASIATSPLLLYLLFDFTLQLDNACFFHVSLRNSSSDVGVSQAYSDASEQCRSRTVFGDLSGRSACGSGSSSISVTKHPGVLFPYFISRLLAAASLDEKGGTETAALIVRGVVNTFAASSSSGGIGGYSSMTALSWVVRSLGDRVNYSNPVLRNSLGIAEIAVIDSFMSFRHKELTNITRECLVDSLMPFVISCANLEAIGVLRFVKTVSDFFSIDKVLFDDNCVELLAERLAQHCMSGDPTMPPVIAADEYELIPVIYSLLHRRLPPQALQQLEARFLLREVMFDASLLFKSTYMSAERQLRAVHMIKGVLSVAVVVHKRSKDGAGHALAKANPLLHAVQSISSDISSYLLISLQSSYSNSHSMSIAMRRFTQSTGGVSSSINSEVTGSTGAHKVTVANTLHLVDVFTQLLGDLLLLQKVTDGYGSPSKNCVVNATLSLATFYESVIDGSHSSSRGMGTAHELQKMLSIRGLSNMLRGLKVGLFPTDKFDFQTVSRLIALLRRVCRALAGGCELNLDNLKAIVDANSSSNSSDVYTDTLIRIGKIPSAYSSLFYDIKWGSLQLLLDLVVAFEMQHIDSINEGDPLCATSLSVHLIREATATIDHVTESSYVSLFDACAIASRRYFHMRSSSSSSNSDEITAEIHNALDIFWKATQDGSQVKAKILIAFINFAFDRSMIENLDKETIVSSFRKVYDSSRANRPHVLQYLLQKLFSVFTAHPLLSLYFFDCEFILELVLYKEPKFLENDVSPDLVKSTACDDSSREPGGTLELREKVCRLIVLLFLESFEVDPASGSIVVEEVRTRVRDLTIRLLKINFDPDFANVAIVSSENFGRKLRCWQGLCILSRYVTGDMLEEVVPDYFATLRHFCHGGIRAPQEMFGASLCVRFPDAMLPLLTARLREYNHPQQELASYFVILAYYTEYVVDGGVTASASAVADVMHSITPWVACALGLPRCIAQMVLCALAPMYLEKCCFERQAPSPYESMAEAVRTNKETAKVMCRQRAAFREVPLDVKMSVRGMRLIKADNLGEIVPEHLLDTIVNIIKSSSENEESDQVVRAVDNGNGEVQIDSLQTKIIPFDELNIAIEDEILSRNRNECGRQRQPLIVCASLVEKVTNLAGICRTCEVFAVEKLLVSSLQACKSEEFKSISVNAELWVKLEQVTATDLVQYVQAVKSEGYVIVGLEQTDTSLLLDSAQATSFLPAKCLLLLGREKEGIPVELLHLVDICLEIPQYGIIRSLNVHVSCAIAVWEITRRNKGLMAFK